jgi:hypothetical protein
VADWSTWRALSLVPSRGVPGGFDQQPSGVLGAGLGDRSLAAGLAGALLGGDQPDVAHQLFGVLEPFEAVDLGA